MDSKKKQNLEATYERIIHVGLCIVPYEDLSDLIAPKMMLFGTTKDEKVFSFSELDAMFKSQYEQMAGLVPSLDRKRLFTQFSNDGNNASITEEATLTISSPENVNTIFMRCSCVMEYINNQWKLTHWHASTPVETENDHWHMEEWKREKEKLQQLVDEQTADLKRKNRELQIEAALERVRARSSAMQYADELGEVIALIFQILDKFDISVKDGVALITFNEGSKDLNEWMANPGFDTAMNFHLPYFDHPVLSNLWDAKNRGEDLLIERYSAEESRSFLNRIFEHSDFKHTPQAVKDYCLAAGTYATSIALQKHTAIFINDYSGISLTPSEVELLKKFSVVFEQTYTRFLDIQKAEAQARESQIETALEKVRSRSLAMHKSEELNEVVSVLFEKLKELQIPFTAIGIATRIEGSKDLNAFVCGDNADGLVITNYRLPYFDNPIPKDLYNAFEKQLDPFVGHYSKEEKDAFYNYVIENTAEFRHLPEDIKQMIFDSTNYTISTVAVKNAVFNVNDFEGKVLVKNEIDIIQRFARVFDQAYTRFLDLQKAEEQAREAQIEVAVERVRAQSMAMNHPDDLDKVNKEILTQLNLLQIQGLSGVTFYLVDQDGWVKAWDFSSPGNIGDQKSYTLQFDFKKYEMMGYPFKIFQQTDLNYLVADYPLEKLERAVIELEEINPAASNAFKEAIAKGLLTHQWSACARISDGILGIDLVSPPSEDTKTIVLKIAGAFNQAYQRFIDLQKAEAQAREAHIEAALERVRSRSMAMHSSDEFVDATDVMVNQLKELDIKTLRIGIGIINKEDDSTEIWSKSEIEGKVKNAIVGVVPRGLHPIFDNTVDAWKEKKLFFSSERIGDEVKEYYEKLDSFLSYPKRTKFNERETMTAFFFNHGSLNVISLEPLKLEECNIMIRFAKVFGQIFQRFLDLQKAEAQARESQIQLALERVRARTMAMQHSDELMETSELMFEQIKNLGIELWSCGFSLWYDDDSYFLGYNPGPHGKLGNPLKIPLTEDIFFTTIREAKRRGDEFLVFESEGESLAETYRYMDGLPVVGETMRGFVEAGFPLPTFQVTHCGFFSNGHLMFITQEPNSEAVDIFKRFTKVFNQTYTRFLDLQKAEAQAREAKIESALERVRSRSLAMHHSSELSAVVDTLMREFTNLEFTLTFCIINLINEQDMSNTVWAANPETGKDPESYYMKFEDYPFHHAMWNAWKAQKKRFVYTLEGEEKKTYDEYLYSETEFRRFPKHVQDANKALERYVAGFTFFKYSGLQTVSVNPISENELEILERFGRVFEQAYTRFLDLQKAEAQAREAQIEAALERVRAQTMAMHSSEDVGKCVVKMFSELTALGVDEGTRFGIGILNHQNENNQLWTARKYGDEVNMHIGNIDMTSHPMLKRARQAWLEQIPFHKYLLEGKDLLNYYRMLNQAPDYKIQIPIEKLPKKEIQHCFIFEHGFFYAFTPREFQAELIHITKRFSSLFEQTYRRYLDLVRAEGQAREAEIELALERLRARTMAMQESDELAEVSSLLFQQMEALGVSTYSSGFTIWDEKQDELISWMCNADGSMNPPFRMPLAENRWHHEQYEYWQNGKDLAIKDFTGEEIQAYFRYLGSFPLLEEAFEKSIAAGHPMPERQLHHVANFSHGNLLFITLEPCPKAHELFKRFAKVFEQTYTRFLDLQKAESQAREAQIEVAVERVRAKALAMHKSGEILQVAITLKEQMEGLNLRGVTAATIYLQHDDSKIRVWDITELKESEKGPQLSSDFTFLLEDTDPGLWVRRIWNASEKYSVIEMSDDDFIKCEKWIREFDETSADNYREFIRAAKIEHTWHPTVQLEKGKLNLDFTVPPPPEMEFILPKMGAAFDLAYRRFLDLQKAEAQTREAQINLAVERVRARALAMFKSEEILEVVYKLKEEIMGLNIPNVSAATIHLTEPDGKYRAWDLTSISGDKNELKISLDIRWEREDTHHDFFMREVWDRKEDYFVVIQGGDRYKHTVEWLHQNGHADYAKEFEEFLESSQLEKVYHPTVLLNNGRMCIDLLDPPAPEIALILKKMAGAFDLAYKRFEDLKKSEEQLREAKIETALEKVRARTMGMQRSDELAEVANVLFDEMNDLVHNLWTCGFVLCEKGRQEDEWWLSLEDGFSRGLFLPNVNDFAHATLYEGWLEGDAFRTVQLDGDKLQEHYDWLMQIPVAKNIFDEMEAAGMQRPEWQKLHAAYFSKGYLVIITREPCPEEEIFKRFAKVFDQTYTRFLDLQKAEAQARESKIETALEKVRSRTMGMQSSNELQEVANIMFLEIQTLDIPAWSCGYNILSADKKVATNFMSNEGTIQKPFNLPLTKENSLIEFYQFLQSEESFFTQVLDGKAIESHYNFMKSLPELTPVFNGLEEAGIALPTFQINHLCKFTHGYLLFITYLPVPEAHDIFKKFTRVFDQTYTRFLDLKKAEARTKEAKIEAALEKVRSRSLAMQKSDELNEVVEVLFEKMKELQIPSTAVAIQTFAEKSKDMQVFVCGDVGTGLVINQYLLPYFDHPIVNDYYNTFKKKFDSFVGSYSKKEKDSFYDLVLKLPELKDLPAAVKTMIQQSNFYEVTMVPAEKSLMAVNDFQGEALSEDQINILKRFAKVFDQTYIRFLDLQRAEAQAKESQIELSLERIRAQVASMQESSDLFDIVVGMRTEFLALGHEADYFWHMRWLPESYEMSMTSEDGSRIGMVITIPKFVHDDIPALAEWEKGNDPIYVLALDPAGAWSYIDNMNTHGAYELADPNAPGKEDIEHIGGLTFIIARTTHGEIGYSLSGMVPKPPKDALDTLVRFAGVFDLAYKRFEDLKAAERQAQMIRDERDRLEIALSELRATQDQLVQQEKLASLGQLTAGIAHEIKNPLNFVNNFSDLSLELITEIKEELSTLSDQLSKEDRQKVDDTHEILHDIEENLQKIHKHGSRADSIVKSMLQHSRGGSGTMQPTDLNALIKEYANLAFHGMRAGKKPINVTLKQELDPEIKEVSLIEEDFTRVVLNLFNNAFDAMRETEVLRPPVLTVRTQKTEKHVSIEIEDNGSGIPEEIKDKILQPFFTTKKGTEGTGLGLSITNDIIKAHGGKLQIRAAKGGGSIFAILLPQKQP